jgi:hypothetical protein
MTSKELATVDPYAPPFWDERAWQPDGRDQWILHAMRAGLVDALIAAIKMDERNPDMRQPVGVETVRFRSNRLRGGSIDTDIVAQVWALSDKDIEELAQDRHETAEDWDHYPRAVLDAFQQDIVDAVFTAGLEDKAAAARWADATASSRSLTARWFDEDTHQLQAVGS